MNENAFLASVWVCGAVVLITLIIVTYLGYIHSTSLRLEEHKSAIAAGLEQQVIDHRIVWVKTDKGK